MVRPPHLEKWREARAALVSLTSARVPAGETTLLATSEQSRRAANASADSESRLGVSEARRPTNGRLQHGSTDCASMPVLELTVDNLNTQQLQFKNTDWRTQALSERAEKDNESCGMSTTNNVVASAQPMQPSMETWTVHVHTADLTFATIPCAADARLQDFHAANRKHFSVGDIGWFPILRPSVCPSIADIQTQFDYVSGKPYPAVIVNMPEDSMIVLLITTAGGTGLKRKPESVQKRSVSVVAECGPVSFRDAIPGVGKSLLPNTLLKVKDDSMYRPCAKGLH
jgi:hypothetical protein